MKQQHLKSFCDKGFSTSVMQKKLRFSCFYPSKAILLLAITTHDTKNEAI